MWNFIDRKNHEKKLTYRNNKIALIGTLFILLGGSSTFTFGESPLQVNQWWMHVDDDTVTDLFTGLMWKRCSEGLPFDQYCSGDLKTYSWQEALQIPEVLNASGGYLGYTDWRLPNVKELRSIVAADLYNPAIYGFEFPKTGSIGYWTSTAGIEDHSTAWYVDFTGGESGTSSRSTYYGVRLVRGGLEE